MTDRRGTEGARVCAPLRSIATVYTLSFRNCISCVYNCDGLSSNNSSLRSSHIWFSYIHNFIIILSRVYNEPIQPPAPHWLVSLIGRALHRYRSLRADEIVSQRSRVRILYKPGRLSFRNCISCVYNCGFKLVYTLYQAFSSFLQVHVFTARPRSKGRSFTAGFFCTLKHPNPTFERKRYFLELFR